MSAPQRSVFGSDTWLFRNIKGASFVDDCMITILKGTYLTFRLGMRILIGRKRRDKYYHDHKITFENYLYGAVEFLHLEKILLLTFTSEEHGFKFYSLITRKTNNFRIGDVCKSMMTHEEDMIEHFTPKEGDVVVDAGAAFGFYTILASKRVGPSGKVVSIEPHPEIHKMLGRNIKLNNLHNTVVLNIALHAKEVIVSLFDNYSIVAERREEAKAKGSMEVKADTLDNLLGLLDLKEVNWIKIDVEGAELYALEGAEKTLANSKDLTLLIEIHGSEMFDQVKGFLETHSFSIVLQEMNEKRDWGHILARKKNTD